MVIARPSWPGPRPYTDDLADVFRGRDQEVTRLLTQVQGQRLSLMTASSGAGKTSILQAGIVPKIREFRLGGRRVAPDQIPTAPFPILLNQWLERARKGERVDYGQLVTMEIYKYLQSSLEWYERRAALAGSPSAAAPVLAESAAVRAALEALASFAAERGFVEVPASGGTRLSLPPDSGDRNPEETVVDRLLGALDIVACHLGEVLLILDQFEEILLDWQLGQQALDAVESVFLLRRSTVRQLISMRHDGLHLVDQLEEKDLLENKRRVKIEPLSPQAVRNIIIEVSAQSATEWEATKGDDEPALLDRLIRAFTYRATGAGVRAGEVNLVGLQVVLNGVCSDSSGATTVDRDRVLDYANGLLGSEEKRTDLSYWLEEGNLAKLAPRDWVIQCLAGRAGCCSEDSTDVVETQIQPLAARMSWLLVTPTGNKRSMSTDELHRGSYGEEMDEIDEEAPQQDLAGDARQGRWTKEDYRRHMEATCDEALARLTRGNILKRRGSETGDLAYELVHDQFGTPFQEWAQSFEKTPEYDLHSLKALKSKLFKWKGALRPHDDDGIIPFARWEDCTLRDVDLSGLTFRNCDFGESLFVRCTFNGVRFEDCDLTNVTFKDHCEFDDVHISGAIAPSIQFVESKLRQVVITVGPEGADGKHGMPFAQINHCVLADCRFGHVEALEDENCQPLLLSMQYAQFNDCTFLGTVEFVKCGLDGSAIRGLTKPCDVDGSLTFDACDMPSFELSNVDARGQALQLVECDCRGASFDRINGGEDGTGKCANIDFTGVTLIGATMTGCVLDDVSFAGKKDARAGEPRTDVSAFTISDRPAEPRVERVPSRISGIVFNNLDAENLSIERCEIVGPISFHDCMLSGATFLGDAKCTDPIGTRKVGGSMRFDEGCDLSAAEFQGLTFEGGHTLQFSDCRLGAAFFYDVRIAGSADVPGAVFDRCDLQGALILGSHLEHVEFCGKPGSGDASRCAASTLVVKPGVKGGRALPAVLAAIRFERIAMPGFMFENVQIQDDLWFDDCDLGGGTIGHVKAKGAQRIVVTGDLHFHNCRMDAIEFRHLQFTDESIRIEHSQCDNARFHEVAFSLESEKEDGLLIKDSDMSGALFLDCEITRSRLTGRSSKHLSRAEGVMFRESENDRAELSTATITNYILDGALVEGLVITGDVVFRDCSLLRTKFSDLEFVGNARLDVTASDLLYAQVDPRLLAAPDRFVMTEEQRAAVTGPRAFEAGLRLQ